MNPAVVAVSLNPALDQTVMLDRLTPGAVQRAQWARVDAGGKAVNVAACLGDWDVEVAVAGVLGADNAAPFEHLFAAKGIEDRCVRLPGATRTNIKLVDEARSETTDINLPGLAVDDDALRVVRRNLRALCRPGSWAVLSGSLPAGLRNEVYAELLAELAEQGVRSVLDTSGAPLAAALDAPAAHLPYAVKPNWHELEAWAGRALRDTADVLEAARGLRQRGIALVVVSLGAEGALFVQGDAVLHARPPAVHQSSTVGAGDAMVAGLTAAQLAGADLEATARLATAFATAKLGRAGASLPSREHVLSLAAAVALTAL